MVGPEMHDVTNVDPSKTVIDFNQKSSGRVDVGSAACEFVA